MAVPETLQCICPNSKFMCVKFEGLVQKVFAKHCNPDDKETGGANRYLSNYHKVSVQI